MTVTADYTGECTALESRADVAALEGLHHERRQLLPEYRTLAALHGPGGKWDAKRKALLEALKVRHRMALQQRSEKVTDATVDALAHGDDQYIAFIDQGIAGHERYVELAVAMTELEERIKDRDHGLYAFSAEARLQR